MSMNLDPGAALASVRHRWRFALVLVASLLLAVAQPLMAGLLGEEGSFDLFFSLLIAAVLFLVFEEREHRWMATCAGVVSLCGLWIGYGFGGWAGRMLLVGSLLLAACIFAFALYRILRAILASQASADAIFGAVCGYLLLGIIWALLYRAVDTACPGSFALSATSKTAATRESIDRGVLSYYSFITLSTVGYGDVTPLTPLARTLAWIEAVAGQFYLATLVAGLVGLKVSQAMKEER